MNEPQFVDAGMALGKRMIKEGGTTPHARLSYGFRLATGRLPTPQESELLMRSLAKNKQRYANDPAAYAMIGSLLLNLDELVSRP